VSNSSFRTVYNFRSVTSSPTEKVKNVYSIGTPTNKSFNAVTLAMVVRIRASNVLDGCAFLQLSVAVRSPCRSPEAVAGVPERGVPDQVPKYDQ
jgi:hypothetical protein